MIRVAALLASIAACGPLPLEDLRRRAAFDFECPEAQIVTARINEDTFGVRGCGQHAVYIHRGTWILNSP